MTPPPQYRRSSRPLKLEPLEDRTVLSTSTVQTALGAIAYDPHTVATSSILVAFTNTTHDYTNYSALAGTSVATKLTLLPGYYVVQVSQAVGVDRAIAAYANSGFVRDVSPDFLLGIQATPNDTQYAQQWSLNSANNYGINASTAWNATKGTTKPIISVMDTGIDYNHVDLYKNIWLNQKEIPTTRKAKLLDIDSDGLITFRDLNDSRNQGTGKITDQNGDGRITADDILAPMKKTNGVDNGLGGWADGVDTDGNKYKDDFVGWNFVTNTNRPDDDNNHGTHVAGIVGAVGNNGVGISGVAWVSQMMAIKFMNSSGQGSIGSYIAGLDYAVANGAKISNNSWAGGSFTSLLYDAIANAKLKGHIYVAAAGNASTNIDLTPSYPASYDVSNVVVVASTSRTGTLSSFSNYGASTVDIAAPGEGILSTLPDNKYGVMGGTSMAAPHVAGELALIWAKNPTWTYTQVINKLLATGQKVSALNGKVTTGAIADAAAALGQVASASNTTTPKVVFATATGTDTNTLNKITVTFSEAVNPSTVTASAVKLLGPSGATISLSSVKAVSNSAYKKFELYFATQNTPGTYSLQLLNTIKNPQGVRLSTYYTTFSIAKTATYANKVAQAVPDNATLTSTIKVNQNAKVDSIALKVNINHTYAGDLALYLVAPSGKKIKLAYRLGGAGNNYTNTVFADSARNSITTAAAPFTGVFKPTEAFSNFKGLSTLGNWKLVVQDLKRGDVGTLLNWSMTITTTNGQTLSTSSTKSQTATIQGFDEEQPPATAATLTTTVSGPGLIGMQLISALTEVTGTVASGTATAAPTRATSYNPGWLVRDLATVPTEERSTPQAVPVVAAESEYADSDAVFAEPVATVGPTPRTYAAAWTHPIKDALEDVLAGS